MFKIVQYRTNKKRLSLGQKIGKHMNSQSSLYSNFTVTYLFYPNTMQYQ